MIYTDMTNKAMTMAFLAHKDQTDKSGIPYIFHPYHLAEKMNSEVLCTIALLHDVAEDSNISMDELEKIFPQEVISPLKLLTHDKKVPYFDYIREIRKDFAATTVKIADLEHNLDETRLVGTPIDNDEVYKRRVKYTKALDYLRGWTDELE